MRPFGPWSPGRGARTDHALADGAAVSPFYDSMLVKVIASGQTYEIAMDRMDRALREFRIRGVKTNVPFLENVIRHPQFVSGEYITRFIDETPALFDFRKRKDRATKLLGWIADVTVNGHPETRGRALPPAHARQPEAPRFAAEAQPGTRQRPERDRRDRREHRPGVSARPRRRGARGRDQRTHGRAAHAPREQLAPVHEAPPP